MIIRPSLARVLALVCSGIMLCSAYAPAYAAALSLARAERLAMLHNPTLASARYEIDAAHGAARQDRLWPNPALTVAGSAGSPLGSPGEFSARVMLAQKVPLTSRIARHAQLGRAGVRLAGARFQMRAWRIRSAVMRAYLRLSVAQDAITVARAAVATNTNLLQVTKERARAAQLSAIVVSSAQVLQAQAHLLLRLWQARHHEAASDLVALMGYRPRILTVTSKPTLWPIPKAAAAIKQALGHRLDLRAANRQRRYEQAAHRYQRARRLGWMTIGAGVEENRQVFVGVPAQPVDHAVGLSISLPLPFWNRNQGNRAAARARVAQAQGQMDALRWQIRQAIPRDIDRLKRLRAQARRYAQLRRSTQASAALALQGLKFGQIHTASAIAVFTERLTVITAWLETRNALAQAQAALRIALGGSYAHIKETP